MNADQLQSYSVVLNSMLHKTTVAIQAGIEDLAGEDVLPPDLVDRAAQETGRAFALLMRERDRQVLAGIREALQRIDDGTYGLCEDCAEDIAPARLRAQPMATLCVHCQGRREDEERARACVASGFFEG